MTLGGTNTYLVGCGPSRVLVDTGEGVPSYAGLLKEALAMASEDIGQPVGIGKVVLTHWHHDHIGGVADVRDMFPAATILKAHTRVLPVDSALNKLAKDLPDGSRIQVDEECTLRILATPGHTDDHLSLVLEEEDAVFTGDCILGAGSSVFSSYCDFMRSLDVIQKLRPQRLYPGHGPVVDNATEYVEKYIAHREKREQQIVASLASNASKRIDDLVDDIYRGSTPENLLGAAALNVSHQLKKLLREKRVVALSADGADASETVLAIDEYSSSAGASMITLAAKAAEMSKPGLGCTECDETAAAGAKSLEQLKAFSW
eukprot:CAMPEP_0174835328 /NCGR_PEP_ID=MMETSP1114-20130205/5347_1 /TAXON_ID=312471 /ORGANISM="Neobodo designis, Strain CCAP 1951/1" /LENGTH=316 /DNA_ID=CAMNT_0016069275 /DNA_START=111 /DNA_END=1058 /DNA_ORIENTATION=-